MHIGGAVAELAHALDAVEPEDKDGALSAAAMTYDEIIDSLKDLPWVRFDPLSHTHRALLSGSYPARAWLHRTSRMLVLHTVYCTCKPLAN